MFSTLINSSAGHFVISKACGQLDFFRTLGLAGLLLAILSSGAVSADVIPNASPVNFRSVSGGIQYSTTNNASGGVDATATTNAQRSIAHTDHLAVGANSSLTANLPNSSAVMLIRDVGGQISEIQGRIDSNGNLFLINPNGILFGTNARVDVNGLVVSSLDLSDADFLAGNYEFKRNGSKGAVINKGTIDGNTVLIGAAIRNEGDITSRNGSINLAVGETVRLDFGDGVTAKVYVTEALKEKVDGYSDAISNTGSLVSKNMKIEARVADSFYDTLVNNEGQIRAAGLSVDDKVNFELIAASDNGDAVVENKGSVELAEVNGSISADVLSHQLLSISGNSNVLITNGACLTY